jgi:hypothetical protein
MPVQTFQMVEKFANRGHTPFWLPYTLLALVVLHVMEQHQFLKRM